MYCNENKQALGYKWTNSEKKKKIKEKMFSSVLPKTNPNRGHPDQKSVISDLA